MPTSSEISDQLESILLSQEFEASKGLADFLRFVVEETLAGRAGEINQRTVGIKGLGYAPNFDPQSNPAVRMQASRLRRTLTQYYLTRGAEDTIRIEIPSGSYVPEFTPMGSQPQHPQQVAKEALHRLSGLEPQKTQPDGPSIAILPFEYLGNDDEHSFLSTGITEEIVIAFTHFPEFAVVGPLDSKIIRHKRLEPREIGREYNVRFLLDGSMRLRGQSLRITSKLTDTRSGRQLWGRSDDYDINMSSVEELEDEIIGRVVAAIADSFGVIPRTLAKEVLPHRRDSISDYEAILRFHHHNRVLTEESLIDAVAALEEVVARDPSHDLAKAMLADFLAAPYFMGYNDDLADLERSEMLARKALALNPRSQQARFAMAQIHYVRGEKTACLAEIEEMLELNPNNANALAISALYLMGVGQGERAHALIQRAMVFNPHHPGWYHFVPYLYHYFQEDYEAARTAGDRFNTPDYFWDPLVRAAVLGQLGRQDEAASALRELLALVPDFRARGRSLAKRMLFQDEHVDMIWDALVRAGLDRQGGHD